MIADPHCANAGGVGVAEGAIIVAKQMTWSFVPWKGVSDLPSDPLGSRIVRHADAHQPPASVMPDHQAIEQLERDGAGHEQIQRSDAGGMIAQESLPTVGRVVGGAGPCTCRRLIQRLRFLASIIPRVCEVRPHSGFSRFVRRISARIPDDQSALNRAKQDSDKGAASAGRVAKSYVR